MIQVTKENFDAVPEMMYTMRIPVDREGSKCRNSKRRTKEERKKEEEN